MMSCASSNAAKPRTAWFLVVVKIGDKYELNIGWRYWDGTVGLYSDAGRTAQVKPPWGCIVSCAYNQANRKGEFGEYFKFENETGKKNNFKIDLMNVMLLGVNNFSQKVASMRAVQQDRLLAKYISSLVRSEGFIYHNPDQYTALGLKKQGEPSNLSSEELDELMVFIELAKEAAFVVTNKSEALLRLEAHGQKAKKTGEGVDGEPPSKIGRLAKIELLKDQEINDDSGVEKSFISRYFGRADVKLEKLSLSDKISIPVNDLKVLAISNSMLQRFDPSLVNFTVYPADPDNFDKNNLEKNDYKIIHGIHRFLALKKLEKKGDLQKLPYMQDKIVTCFLVNVYTDTEVVYGNIRGNDLASKFQRQPYIHELVFIFESFKKANNNNSSKALELIVRFAKLLLAHPDEITALRKISTWSDQSFQSLVSVLKKFEMYETMDCEDNLDRKNSRLLRGEKMKLTKEMFILLGKCDQEYFKDNAHKVIKKEISLKCLLESVKKVLQTNKTKKLVTTLTNYKSTENLEKMFPGKFTEEKIERFSGAEIEKNKYNQKGKLLKKYCESVLEEQDSECEPVKYEYIEDLSEVKLEVVEVSDIVVLNLSKVEPGFAIDAIDIILKTSKASHSLLLLFEIDRAYTDALSYISTFSLPQGITFKSVFFEIDRPKIEQGFINNAVYGILLGKVRTFGPSVKIIHGNVERSLADFISAISPLPVKIAFLNEGNLQIYPVHHDVQEDVEVQYFGSRVAIDKFLNKKHISKTVSQSSSKTDSSLLSQYSSTPTSSQTKLGIRRYFEKRNIIDIDNLNNGEFDVDESFNHTRSNNSMIEDNIQGCSMSDSYRNTPEGTDSDMFAESESAKLEDMKSEHAESASLLAGDKNIVSGDTNVVPDTDAESYDFK